VTTFLTLHFSEKFTVFCCLCFINGNLNPVYANSNFSTSTGNTHLRKKHPLQYDSYLNFLTKQKQDESTTKAARVVARTPLKRDLTQTVLTPVTTTTTRLTNLQLHREFQRWLVTSCRPGHIAKDAGLRTFLGKLSSKAYQPPDPKTMEKIEVSFEGQLRKNIRNILVHEGFLTPDGLGPNLNSFPFLSLSIDKSTAIRHASNQLES
jgi:hypothetical protein